MDHESVGGARRGIAADRRRGVRRDRRAADAADAVGDSRRHPDRPGDAAGFVGVSLEYKAHAPATPVATRARSIRCSSSCCASSPGQAPVLRIGGDSTDATWWPVRGVIPPGGILRADPGLAADHAGARHDARGTADPGDQPRRRTARRSPPPRRGRSCRASAAATSRRSRSATSRTSTAVPVVPRPARPRRLTPAVAATTSTAFMTDFSRWRAALPTVPLAGPAFSAVTG